jgi:glycosyltransferase involved in cell wall biosynthesis
MKNITTAENIEKQHRKFRVVHVCAIDWTVQVMLKPQMLALKDAGYDVCAMCVPGKYQKALKEVDIEIVPVDIRRSMTPLQDLRSLWQLYRNFRKGKYDIVHTHTPKVSLFGQMAAWFARVPIIVNTVHGFYFHDDMEPKKRRFYILMEKIAAKFSSLILSQNPEDVKSAVELGICKPELIKLLGNGIDLNRFSKTRFGADFRQKKRLELGLPQDAFVIGIIGRLVKEKGYIELFEAISSLTQKGYSIRLLCIGPDEPEKDDAVGVEDIKRCRIEKITTLLGHRNDIEELMMAMDIYCLPSYREGYPRSAMEASAMSLPVIATNIRGCREVVSDGETGFLVPARDYKKLSEAIEKLISDNEKRLQMGIAGRKKAEKLFDEQNVIKIIKEEYERLLRAL